jgi:hypothetical protein
METAVYRPVFDALLELLKQIQNRPKFIAALRRIRDIGRTALRSGQKQTVMQG